jgi:hypothetical protein
MRGAGQRGSLRNWNLARRRNPFERGRTAESCHCQGMFGALSSGHRSKPEKIRIARFRTQQQEKQLTENRNLTIGVFVICS